MLVVWFAAFGFLSAYGPLLIAHGKSLLSTHQVGRGLTVLNMGSMGGTFLSQTISEFVIGLFPTAPDGAYDLTPTAWCSACRRLLSYWHVSLISDRATPWRAAEKRPRAAVCIERSPAHAKEGSTS